MLSHNSLQHYYSMIFALAQHHKYQISELENLIPYERDIYFGMLVDFIQRVEEQNRNKQ